MAENDDAQEKSQEPSQKRQQDLKKEGTVPRSKELNKMLLIISAAALLWMSASHIYIAFRSICYELFSLSHNEIFDSQLLWLKLTSCFKIIGISFIPLFVLLFLIALLSPVLMGGWIFSIKAFSFKPERMSPIKGIGRIFSLNSLMELFKAIGKFLLVIGFGIFFIWWKFDQLMALGLYPAATGIVKGLSLFGFGFFLVASALVFITIIDVPFQIMQYLNKAKMSFKELKDEMKQTEGSPEIKMRLREAQQEMTNRRMMEAVPDADVVITNPTHYAVALKYDESLSVAPKVVAMGVDHIAFRIMELAKDNNVTLVSLPPLARAIYFNAKIGREIPKGLYIAVARVLAYVYQLKHYDSGLGRKPFSIKDSEIPIPQELKDNNKVTQRVDLSWNYYYKFRS